MDSLVAVNKADMNVLVLGCGSIARRHIHNLVKFNDIRRVFVYTKSKDCFNALDNSSNKIKGVKSIPAVNADLALICNQTNRHLASAIMLAESGVNIFVEKPLSMDLGNVFKLKMIVARKKIKFAVGYNLRFLKAIEYVKSRLSAGDIGDLYFARIEVGQYLPDWRKTVDYRNSYSAKRSQGGGVALDLSHEIDYMRYLFGDPRSWELAKTKVSNLKIDSEDIFEGVYKYDKFICQVHLDYLQKEKKRIIKIEGSRGMLMCDLINKEIIIEANGRKEVISDKRLFDLDRTYIDEISGFIKSIKKGRNFIATFDDGLKVLKLIKA